MKQTSIIFFILVIICSSTFSCKQPGSGENESGKPNIVIIYVDDLGYSDLETYGAMGVRTPSINELDQMGIRFQDAHSSAATCTPSRFALLTGSYAFRKDAAILPGDAPLLITPGTPTLASMLKGAGYTTSVIGKWHLGLGEGRVDWNGKIKPGPLEIGFDHCYLIPATGDRVPCVWIEDHHVVNLDPSDPIEISYSEIVGDLPTGLMRPDLLIQAADSQHSGTIINGINRIGYMKGGRSAWWKDEDFADILTHKADSFIVSHREEPFFLFFSYHDIHVPRQVHPRFRGASEMGPRGDAIAQMDWCTGQIIESLRRNRILEKTLIIFTSDNGPVLKDGYMDGAEELVGDHNPSGPFRGGKYSNYEAGTRIPTIVCWPGKIQPGISDALISQVDIYASLAKLVGHELISGEAPDSYTLLDTWMGKSALGRDVLVEEASSLSLRKGNWKYISPSRRGGPARLEYENIETGLSPEPQLYDLSEDPGENHNLATLFPEKAEELSETLKEIITRGSSR